MKYILTVMLALVFFAGSFALFDINFGRTYSDAIGVVDVINGYLDDKIVDSVLNILDFTTGRYQNYQSAFYKFDSISDESILDEHKAAFNYVKYCVRLPIKQDVFHQSYWFLQFVLTDTHDVVYKWLSDTDIFFCFDSDGSFVRLICLYNGNFAYSNNFSGSCSLSNFSPYTGVCKIRITSEFDDGTIRDVTFTIEADCKGSFIDMLNKYCKEY